MRLRFDNLSIRRMKKNKVHLLWAKLNWNEIISVPKLIFYTSHLNKITKLVFCLHSAAIY